MRLKDKVAIVTGGAAGIGRAYCFGLAREGAKVVIADINEKGALATGREIEAKGGKALALKVDVSDPQSTLAMAEKAGNTFGRIDVLVNNAAFYLRPALTRAPFQELPLDEWDRVMAVNLKGPFLCSRAVLPYMQRQKAGKIINISSDTVYFGPVTMAHYVTSKAGVIGLTRSMARELGPYNINVNCIAPGSTFSEEPDNLERFEFRKQLVANQVLKRVEMPEDLVGAVIFLASSESDFVTGQTIVVNGGTTML